MKFISEQQIICGMEQIFNIAKVPQNVRELFKQTRVGIKTFADLAQSQEKREKFQKDYGLSSDKILLICDLVRQEAKTNPSLQVKAHQLSAALSSIQNSSFKVQQPVQMMMPGNRRRNLLLANGQKKISKIPASNPKLPETNPKLNPLQIPQEVKIPQQSLSFKNGVSEAISQVLPPAAAISLKSPPQTERLTMTEFMSETPTTLADSRQVSTGPKDRIRSPSLRVTANFDANEVPISEQCESLRPFEKVEDTIMIDVPLNILEQVSDKSPHELDISEQYKDGPKTVPISPPLDLSKAMNTHSLQDQIAQAEPAQAHQNLLPKDDTLSEDYDLSMRYEEEEVVTITEQVQNLIKAHNDQHFRVYYAQNQFEGPILSPSEKQTLEAVDQGCVTSSESLSSSPSQEMDVMLQNECLPSESAEEELMMVEESSVSPQLTIPELDHAPLQVAQSEHIVTVDNIQENKDPLNPDFTETLQESSSSSESCPLTDQAPYQAAPPSDDPYACSFVFQNLVPLDQSSKPSLPKVEVERSLLIDVGCQCEPWKPEVVEAPKKKMKNKKFQVTQKKIEQSYETIEEKSNVENQVIEQESSEESEREESKYEGGRTSRTIIKTKDEILQATNHSKKSDNESQSSELTFNYFQDLSHPVAGSPCNSQRPENLRPILKKRLREEVQEKTCHFEDYDEDLNDLSYLTQQPTKRKRVRFDAQVYADQKRRENQDQMQTIQSSTPKSRTMLQRPCLSNDKNQFAPNAFNNSKPAIKASQKAIYGQKKRFQEDHCNSSNSSSSEYEEEKVGMHQARGHQAMKEPRTSVYGSQIEARLRVERDLIKRQTVEEYNGKEEDEQEAFEQDEEQEPDEQKETESKSEKLLFKQQILNLLNAFKK